MISGSMMSSNEKIYDDDDVMLYDRGLHALITEVQRIF